MRSERWYSMAQRCVSSCMVPTKANTAGLPEMPISCPSGVSRARVRVSVVLHHAEYGYVQAQFPHGPLRRRCVGRAAVYEQQIRQVCKLAVPVQRTLKTPRYRPGAYSRNRPGASRSRMRNLR